MPCCKIFAGILVSLLSGMVTPLFGLFIGRTLYEMKFAAQESDDVLHAIKMLIIYIVLATLAILFLKSVSMIIFSKMGHLIASNVR